jgi:hypothetical protein
VYRGTGPDTVGPGEFFSESRRFAESYGDVQEYSLGEANLFDITKPEHFSMLHLPVFDPFDDTEIGSLEGLDKENTWEVTEYELASGRLNSVVKHRFDGAVVTEGGERNYWIWNLDKVQSL